MRSVGEVGLFVCLTTPKRDAWRNQQSKNEYFCTGYYVEKNIGRKCEKLPNEMTP